MTEQSKLNRVSELKADLAVAEKAAVVELQEQRASLVKELEKLDAEILRVTGKSPVKAVRKGKIPVKAISLEQLKALAASGPVNVRKAKLDFKVVKGLVDNNPSVLALSGKGPWPLVSLVA